MIGPRFWRWVLGNFCWVGGLIGLLLSSALMIVLWRLSPILQSRRQRSLRDQDIEPVPRFGRVVLFWGFVGSMVLLWWLPFEQRGLGLQLLPVNCLVGLCLGGLLAWSVGFADDIFYLRARWKISEFLSKVVFELKIKRQSGFQESPRFHQRIVCLRSPLPVIKAS